MDALQQQLEQLMSFLADTELQFEDGTIEGNSTVLSFFSSVLRGAVEAHTAAAKGSELSKTRLVIPIEGVYREEWMQVAPYWYPVSSVPALQTCEQVEVLLKVGSRFDLQPVLQKADSYIVVNCSQLVKQVGTPTSIWKWIHLADKSCLQESLPVLASRVVELDRTSCSAAENMLGLSALFLQKLVAALCAARVTLPCACCHHQPRVHAVTLTHRCTQCGRQTSA